MTTVMFLHRYIPPYVTMYVQSTYIEHSEHTTKKKHPPKEQFGLQKTIVVGGICVTTTHHDSHFTHQYLRDVLTKLFLTSQNIYFCVT